MPFRPLISFIYNNNSLYGPFEAFGMGNLWEGFEFELSMENSFHENFLRKRSGSAGCAFACFDFYSRCQPLKITMEPGKIITELYRAWARGEIFDKLEIYWIRSGESDGKEEIYLTQSLYPAKIVSIRFLMPDVKDRDCENLGHMLKLELIYRFTEITFLPGYHHFRLDWNNLLTVGKFNSDQDSFNEFDLSFEKIPTISKEERLARISIHSLGWEHLDEDKRCDSEISQGDRIRLLADVEGVSDGEKIRFELYYRTPDGQTIEFASKSGIIIDGTGTAEWIADTSDILEKEYSIHFEPVVRSKYGGRCEIPLKRPYKGVIVPWFIDCHMHIQSTMCAPEPLISGMPFLKKLRSVPKLPGFIGTPGLIFNKSTTEELGKLSLEKSSEILNDRKLTGLGDPEKRRRLMLVMPMDMDFGHYRGYSGIKIIENTEKGLIIYKSINTSGVECALTEFKKWEQYFMQLAATQKIFLNSGGEIVPFFHYDPRRWNSERWNPVRKIGHWKDPFSFLVQTGNISDLQETIRISRVNGDYLNLAFFCGIGFKMYTALGYKPDDYDKLPGLSSFYGECVKHRIPILCHGSRGGMLTHDWLHYCKKDLRHFNQNTYDNDDIPPSMKNAKDYYYENFISPYAWEQVLQRFPQLHLCLAHFGGEESWGRDRFKFKPDWFSKLCEMMRLYPNFYVDTSYFMFDDLFIGQFAEAVQDEKVRNKILFGTDWYMINFEWSRLGHGSSYRNFFRKTYNKFIDTELLKIDNYFPARALVLNPLRFLNFKEILPKLNTVYKCLTGKEISLMEWVPELPETIEQFKGDK